jgi:hypothetical protein
MGSPSQFATKSGHRTLRLRCKILAKLMARKMKEVCVGANMNSVFVLVNTLLSAIVGAGLGSILPFLIKRRDEQNESRVAKLRITTPLVAIMMALRHAYLTRQVDRSLLAVWLRQYAMVAREPDIIKHLSTSESKWALRTASMFDVTTMQLESSKWEDVKMGPSAGPSTVSAIYSMRAS